MQFLETHHNAQFVISESAISEDRDGVGQPRNTQSSIMLRESLLAADDSHLAHGAVPRFSFIRPTFNTLARSRSSHRHTPDVRR